MRHVLRFLERLPTWVAVAATLAVVMAGHSAMIRLGALIVQR